MSILRVNSITNEAGTAPLLKNFFAKADPREVAWTKTGAGTAETQTELTVEVNGIILIVASGTSITMPSLTAGTDYAIWLETDGDLVATTNHTSPPTANARKIGGFHYAPGGNAAAQAGGDTTPAINEYSFWDLKFRPACEDPRGMACISESFWSDIYLLNTDPDVNGTSSHGKTIADGSSPPKIPTIYGGNGTTTYGTLTWFEAQEIASAYGKRTPTYSEFVALAYGVKEEHSIKTDPVTTGLVDGTGSPSSGEDTNAEAYTSKWGIIQATGNLLIWGKEVTGSGDSNSAGWSSYNTESRGDIYYPADFKLTASRLGGAWSITSNSGSRCSFWNNAASNSSSNIGSRFVCDHLILD